MFNEIFKYLKQQGLLVSVAVFLATMRGLKEDIKDQVKKSGV